MTISEGELSLDLGFRWQVEGSAGGLLLRGHQRRHIGWYSCWLLGRGLGSYLHISLEY